MIKKNEINNAAKVFDGFDTWNRPFQASKLVGPILVICLLTFDTFLILFGALVLRRITQHNEISKKVIFYNNDSIESNSSFDDNDN